MKTTLHDVGSSFDERTACLQVALGTVSALRRFRGMLERYAPVPGRRDGPANATPPPAAPEERAALELLLGLVSVSQHLMHYVDLARARREDVSGALRSVPVISARNLKSRDLLDCPS